MSVNTISLQSGKTARVILLPILAADYCFHTQSSGAGYLYRLNQAIGLHGIVHREHSDIPATRIEGALVRLGGPIEQDVVKPLALMVVKPR